MTTPLFEQRLSTEQRSQVLAWFPELRYDPTQGLQGFYDPDLARQLSEIL